MKSCIKTHLEIREELYTKLCAPPHSPLRDASYIAPRWKWIAMYCNWLTDGRRDMPQVLDKWDCDDYMMWAITEAALCKAEGSMDSFTGFALCGVYVRINPSAQEFLGIPLAPGRVAISHACILVRDADEDGGVWWILEPQTSKMIAYEAAIKTSLIVSIDYVLGL